MRMHSYGKFSPNLVSGALIIFSLIVLYNYWNVSTHNRDLLLRIHVLEEQAIVAAKHNAELQSALEKLEGVKTKFEFKLHEEEVAEKELQRQFGLKEESLNSLRKQNVDYKKEVSKLHDILAETRLKLENKEKVESELRSKISSIESQLVEKGTEIDRLSKLVKEKSSPNSGGPGTAPKVDDSLSQPVLMNDPAEQQMNPDVALAPPPLPSLEIKSGKNGVNKNLNLGSNLDAAEDDGERGKEEGGLLDDQSPDGNLQQPKEGTNLKKNGLKENGEENREDAHLQEMNSV